MWSKHEEQPDKDVTTGFWDFKKHDVDGTTYYSYHDQNYKMDNYGLLGYAPGERVIMDAECMSVWDFSAGKKLLSVSLGDPQNITYRCVYYE